jgi:hypothetical protein
VAEQIRIRKEDEGQKVRILKSQLASKFAHEINMELTFEKLYLKVQARGAESNFFFQKSARY